MKTIIKNTIALLLLTSIISCGSSEYSDLAKGATYVIETIDLDSDYSFEGSDEFTFEEVNVNVSDPRFDYTTPSYQDKNKIGRIHLRESKEFKKGTSYAFDVYINDYDDTKDSEKYSEFSSQLMEELKSMGYTYDKVASIKSMVNDNLPYSLYFSSTDYIYVFRMYDNNSKYGAFMGGCSIVKQAIKK